MTLAIFDLDNTLIGGDSDHLWGEYLISRNIVDAASYRQQNDQFYRDYQNGCLDIRAYQEFVLTPLTVYSALQLQQFHQQYMSEWIEPILLPRAFELIAKHRQQNHVLMIITATNRFVTEPIAKRLGIDNLLATEPEVINDRFSGKISGVPCYQQGKVERLKRWLNLHPSLSLQGSYFYSDSINDVPLLTLVDNPVAVDPDNKLRDVAIKNNWPIISLR